MALRYISPLHKAYRQVGLHLEERMAELGILPGEGHLLTFLLSWEPSPISELLRVFGVKKSTFTGRLDRLADRGLITRKVNPEDRRSFLVGLTARGRWLARRANGITEELEAKMDSHTTARDLTGFRRVLDAIGEVTGVEVRPTEEKETR